MTINKKPGTLAVYGIIALLLLFLAMFFLWTPKVHAQELPTNHLIKELQEAEY